MAEVHIRGLRVAFYGVWRMRCYHVHRQGKRKLEVANWTAS